MADSEPDVVQDPIPAPPERRGLRLPLWVLPVALLVEFLVLVFVLRTPSGRVFDDALEGATRIDVEVEVPESELRERDANVNDLEDGLATRIGELAAPDADVRVNVRQVDSPATGSSTTAASTSTTEG